MENLTKLNYVSQAENVILSLREKDKWGNETIRITSTKLRNMLTMSSGLYNKLLKNRAEKLSEDLQRDIQYLRMRFAYESGPDRVVDFFVM
ncbi:MAG: type III-A CRISPR-associated protein Csm2 [Lachnospiraceae bacterium]|nr:type III-A CRISPR-associated protein Csm2 [Lachnospiraceae bacterium]